MGREDTRVTIGKESYLANLIEPGNSRRGFRIPNSCYLWLKSSDLRVL